MGSCCARPDGLYIVGVSAFSNSGTASTLTYVYETASGTVLRSRIVVGQSSTLSIAPDGSSFMAGFSLYDIATLNVIAQQNIANAPFAMSSSFTVTNNVGGSAFAPDGTTLYSAFNVAPQTTPAPSPQAATLLISDRRNLGIRLGINLPESIIAKMVMTADGKEAWGLSSSGVIHLPLSTLYDYPILMPDTTTVLLAQDDCNPGIARGSVRINNIGGGTLSFAVPQAISGGSAALVVTAQSGLAPASINFVMDPGRQAVIRTPGTNLYTGAGSNNTGAAVNIQLVSPNAINVPPVIRVFMNYRDSTMRGLIYPSRRFPIPPPRPTKACRISCSMSRETGFTSAIPDTTRSKSSISRRWRFRRRFRSASFRTRWRWDSMAPRFMSPPRAANRSRSSIWTSNW